LVRRLRRIAGAAVLPGTVRAAAHPGARGHPGRPVPRGRPRPRRRPAQAGDPPLADHCRGRPRRGRAARALRLAAARADRLDSQARLARCAVRGDVAGGWPDGAGRGGGRAGRTRRHGRPTGTARAGPPGGAAPAAGADRAGPAHGPGARAGRRRPNAHLAGPAVAGTATSHAAGGLGDQAGLQLPLSRLLPARGGAAGRGGAGRANTRKDGNPAGLIARAEVGRAGRRPGHNRGSRRAHAAQHPGSGHRHADRLAIPGRSRAARRRRHLPGIRRPALVPRLSGRIGAAARHLDGRIRPHLGPAVWGARLAAGAGAARARHLPDLGGRDGAAVGRSRPIPRARVPARGRVAATTGRAAVALPAARLRTRAGRRAVTPPPAAEPPAAAAQAAAPQAPARRAVRPAAVPARWAWPGRWARAAAGRPAARQLAILGCYLASGVVLTWPRAGYLVDHKLPATRDAAAFVWGFWWLAHQAEHLASPWSTSYLAAPAGAQLGLHTLMPLEGLVMMPVTVAFGPSASYNLLSAAMPGLLCYAAYRVARLWLSPPGAIAAGGFFGLSGMLTWRSWYHLNLAAGAVFLPLALATALQLRREPSGRRCVILGLTLAACLLTDLESAVMAAIVVMLVLVPWLARQPSWAKVRAAGLAAGVAVVAGAPQLAAIAWQAAASGTSVGARLLGESYLRYSTPLAGLFAPSPRLADAGLTRLAAIYYRDGVTYQTIGHRYLPVGEGAPMFGVVLTALALAGLALAWRRRSARLLALAWLGAAALAVGPVLRIGGHPYVPAARMLDGARVSSVLPYTWFVQIP